MGKRKLAEKFQVWTEARRRFHLSRAHVQMPRELGLNPKKLAKVDNADQEPWKQPLPQFIEHLYFKRFGRERPGSTVRMEKRRQFVDKEKVRRRKTQQARATEVTAHE